MEGFDLEMVCKCRSSRDYSQKSVPAPGLSSCLLKLACNPSRLINRPCFCLHCDIHIAACALQCPILVTCCEAKCQLQHIQVKTLACYASACSKLVYVSMIGACALKAAGQRVSVAFPIAQASSLGSQQVYVKIPV